MTDRQNVTVSCTGCIGCLLTIFILFNLGKVWELLTLGLNYLINHLK